MADDDSGEGKDLDPNNPANKPEDRPDVLSDEDEDYNDDRD